MRPVQTASIETGSLRIVIALLKIKGAYIETNDIDPVTIPNINSHYLPRDINFIAHRDHHI